MARRDDRVREARCEHCGEDWLVPVQPREPEPFWRDHGFALGAAVIAALLPFLPGAGS